MVRRSDLSDRANELLRSAATSAKQRIEAMEAARRIDGAGAGRLVPPSALAVARDRRTGRGGGVSAISLDDQIACVKRDALVRTRDERRPGLF